MEPLTLASVIIVLLSALPLVMVLVQWKRRRSFKKKAVATMATVLHCEQKRAMKGGLYFVISLQYTTSSGQQFSVVHVGAKKQERGDLIPLMYLLHQPDKFTVNFGQRTPLAILLCFLFFAFIIWLFASLNGFI